jgi:hypothetical protein
MPFVGVQSTFKRERKRLRIELKKKPKKKERKKDRGGLHGRESFAL